MDYNRLYTFIKVAERESITKAASDLYLTQQAVSKQLILLEEELQLKLFTRSHKSLHLTRDGQSLMAQLSPLFEQMDQAVLSIQGKVGDLGGTIKIGASLNEMEINKFFGKIKSFKRNFSNVRFELVFDIDYTIEDKLLANEIDIGILSVFRDDQMLKAEKLETKRALLCCSELFNKTHGPFHNYSDLIGVPFAEYTHNFPGFAGWMKMNCPHELKRFMGQQPEMIVESVTAISNFVSDGLCMGFLPEGIFKNGKRKKS